MKFDFTKTSEACVKCAKCVPSCTIHRINSDEVTSPRGFLELVGAYQRGELELDKNAKDIFEKCFLCTTCVSICPTSLPTDLAIENIRFEIAEKFGIAWFKRGYFFLLRHRKLMDFCFSLASFLLPVLFKLDYEAQSMKPRFSLPFVGKRVFPLLNKRSFLQRHKEEIKNGSDTKRVALFVGCFSNYHYTKTADSLLDILKALKINVFIPREQRCCGAPAFFTGDFKTVEKLIKQNVEYFETFIDDIDAIIIPEATCAAMIKEDWGRFMAKQPEWLKRVEKITSKVFMASEWLYAKTNLLEYLKNLRINDKERVTYHDPCHARKVLKVFKEPRGLLAENYELAEMSDPNQCCGFGGVTIQSEKFELSKMAAKPKVEMIKRTGAKILSAECGACRMQLSNAIDSEGIDVKFKHPLELIAKAIREDKKLK
ncbi:MAG: (Fe-S)-binding protein [Campylobacteraceae bacterium]|jgi:glycolate oxidase iron-sulfur subunit|nr:(Fe-S)-binding protein [Campylobacteraceae bacterium]